MKLCYDPEARKRPVNLTLNEDLGHAKRMTDNLSAVVETLLADFVSREQRARQEKSKAIEATVGLWNKFNDERGSFADEYSSASDV